MQIAALVEVSQVLVLGMDLGHLRPQSMTQGQQTIGTGLGFAIHIVRNQETAGTQQIPVPGRHVEMLGGAAQGGDPGQIASLLSQQQSVELA